MARKREGEGDDEELSPKAFEIVGVIPKISFENHINAKIFPLWYVSAFCISPSPVCAVAGCWQNKK